MSICKGDNLIAGPVLDTDVALDPIPTEGSLRHVMSGGVYDALLPKEDVANKTTVVDSSSTNDQYPSAKAVYDALGGLEPANIEYARDLYTPDWTKANVITSDALLLGYPAPKRGIFIGSTVPYDLETGLITLNGLPIGYSVKTTAIDYYPIPINLSVSTGDIIKSSVRMQLDTTFIIRFVPYKRQ